MGEGADGGGGASVISSRPQLLPSEPPGRRKTRALLRSSPSENINPGRQTSGVGAATAAAVERGIRNGGDGGEGGGSANETGVKVASGPAGRR